MGRQVRVVAYDPTWPECFGEEANQLYGILGQEVIAIHHIGSTSIPNICSKPIIDILIEVVPSDDICGSVYNQQGTLVITARLVLPGVARIWPMC